MKSLRPNGNLIVNALKFEPKFKLEGGTIAENLTLQNIQARCAVQLVSSVCPHFAAFEGTLLFALVVVLRLVVLRLILLGFLLGFLL
jgi:hypothetical protein